MILLVIMLHHIQDGSYTCSTATLYYICNGLDACIFHICEVTDNHVYIVAKCNIWNDRSSNGMALVTITQFVRSSGLESYNLYDFTRITYIAQVQVDR